MRCCPKVIRLLLSSVTLLFLFSCTRNPVFSDFAGIAQGTTYSVKFENRGNINPAEMKSEVETILSDFDMSLSLYVDSSILSAVNRNEDISPDEYFTEVFRLSVELSELTGGAFDITVGPLVRAWGFGPDGQKNVSPLQIDSLLRLVGIEKVDLKDGRIIKSDPRITLDFNAIAQGYAVDVICRHFDRAGIKRYLVEIGGEVRVKGDKGGVPWRIGIDRPVDDNVSPGSDLKAVIELEDRSLATSGNYRKFYVENGIKYSHTIDPKTGYPAKNRLLSATILADDCATADAIATACMVMGMDESVAFLETHPQFEGYLIYSDDTGNFRTWVSEKISGNISEIE